MSTAYGPVPDEEGENVPLALSSQTHHTPRISLRRESDASSTEFRDQLEVEPFDEKGDRFRDDPRLEDEAGDGNEDEQGYAIQPPQRLRSRQKSRKILAILITILAFAAAIGVLAASGYSAPTFGKSGNQRITMDHVFNGTFNAWSKQLDWVKQAADGTFSHINKDNNIVLADVHNMTEETLLVDSSKVTDEHGNRLHWQSWQLSSDMEYVLFKTDHVKQWRHSSFGNYWVHRRSDSVTFPVLTPSSHPTITKCVWSPVGHALAFVSKNDLYVITEEEMHSSGKPKSTRITTDGSETIFNGVPDWVYEEEVFETDGALWWSPNAESIAYLRSDESAVKDFKLQYYNPSNDAFEVHQYATELDMKYPKPGTPNPLATVHTYTLSTQTRHQLAWEGEMPLDNRIIIEVGWVADNGLLVKEIDRAARKGNVVLFQDGKTQGDIVRILGKEGEEGDDGWIDHGQNVIPVRGALEGYLDIVPNEGYNHIALFSPINATKPIWITSGEWEVTQISGVNVEKEIIYFMAATPSIDRHLYSAPMPTSATEQYDQTFTALTDNSSPGYYEAFFSPGAGYYVLGYRGPEVPWQRLLETDPGEEPIDVLLEGNAQLNQTLSEFVRPIITRQTIESDGYEINVLEMLPPNIDTSGRKKYPVLMRVYGGPGSQMVHNRFERDWHSYLVTTLKYIVVVVDGRGTGFKGRRLRNPVIDDLGHYEVIDQINAAKEMAKRSYVDRKRIGIWGWSYGGYMTCKTIETDSGIFTLGMAVAPVTNWLYYDSIYTERYMSVPSSNQDGYIESAVNNVTSFAGDKVDFIWAHGSGDDNVHYANSASLLDKLTQEKIRGWRFRMFTDSNHSMDKRQAYREVYEWMTDFLKEKWGVGGKIHH